jgi:muramoyltetrapeptide carboxypeptidase
MSWEPLKTGDIVDVVAPSYGVTAEDIEKVEAYIKSLGLEPNIPTNLMDEHLFCSNSSEYRFLHLKNSLKNDESKAVWCVRGGYGATQLLPMLDELEAPEKQKLFIGFSDITAIHIFLNQQWGWSTIHGPVLWQVAHDRVDSASLNELNAIIFGQQKEVIFGDIKPLNAHAEEKKEIESQIIGGNLSLVQCSLGTDWEIRTVSKILFLEDTDEKSYAYERMMLHLSQSGIIERADAVILGDFQHHADEVDRLDEMLQRFADIAPVPVLKLDGVGHGTRNDPLPLGTDSQLGLGENISLKINAY